MQYTVGHPLKWSEMAEALIDLGFDEATVNAADMTGKPLDYPFLLDLGYHAMRTLPDFPEIPPTLNGFDLTFDTEVLLFNDPQVGPPYAPDVFHVMNDGVVAGGSTEFAVQLVNDYVSAHPELAHIAWFMTGYRSDDLAFSSRHIIVASATK